MDYELELERVMTLGWVLYRGVILKPYGDEFMVLGKICGNMDEVNEVINNAQSALSKSILKGKEVKGV